MKKTIRLVFIVYVLASSLAAHAVDRKPMVNAIEKIFPVLVGYVEQLKETKDRDGRDLRILKDVGALSKSHQIPIIFSQNSSEFDLKPGEPTRLMRATGQYDTELNQLIDPGAIYVNEPLLNNDDQTINLSLLIKLLFHEYAHKTGEENWGVRDRLAQYFVDQIDPYIRQEWLNNDIELTILSLPIAKIDRELTQVSINRPQPSNLILVRRGGEIADITENLHKKMDTSSEMLRAMWAELNKVLMGVAREFLRIIDLNVKPELGAKVEQMKAFMNEVAPGNKIDYSDLDSFLTPFDEGPKELRVLELAELQKTEIDLGVFVNLRSTYLVGRTSRSNFSINVTGFPYSEIFPVPTTIHFVIPKDPKAPLSDIQFDVQVRPDVDYQNVAKVQSVIRQGADVSVLKLRVFKSEKLKSVKDVRLSTRFPGGFQLVRAKDIVNIEGGWELSFHFSPDFYSQKVSHVGDSLLLNGDHAIYLDRLVTLTEGLSAYGAISSSTELIADSVGFWGLKEGRPAFQKKFSRKEMVYFIDNVKMDPFSFNPSNLTVEFKVNQKVKIREVRVYLHRQMFLMDISGHGPVQAMPYQGQLIPISNQGAGLIETKEFQDIISFSQSSIKNIDDTTFRATTMAPMKFDFKFNRPNLAYGPPLAWPIMVEVITEDLQVLRHHFSEKLAEDDSCFNFLSK